MLAGKIKQPAQVSCGFKANGGEMVTWKIRNEKLMEIKPATTAGNTIQVYFPSVNRKTQNKYVIEAYGQSSTLTDKTSMGDIETDRKKYYNMLVIEVAPNELTLQVEKEKIPVGQTITITEKALFDKLPVKDKVTNYKALKNGIESTAAEFNGTTVKFTEPGSYVITAEAGATKVNPVKDLTVEKVMVAQVTVNQKEKCSGSKNTPFNFNATLNYPEMADSTTVNWQVKYSENNKNAQVIYPKSATKPSQEIFGKKGYYQVFAFINGKSSQVKADVQVTEPTFVECRWQDLNGNKTTETGRKEKVYAHIKMEGVAGVTLKAELRNNRNNAILQTYTHTMSSDGNTLVATVEMTEEIARQLQWDDKLYFIVYDKNTPLKEKTQSSKDFPVQYVWKEKITSLLVAADKECKQPVSAIEYGKKVYVRVLTRNLSGEALELYVFRKTPGVIFGNWWPNEKEMFKAEQKTDNNGTAVFELTVDKSWRAENKSDTYFFRVKETGKNTDTQSEKTYLADAQLAAQLKAFDRADADGNGQSKTEVNQVNGMKKICICKKYDLFSIVALTIILCSCNNKNQNFNQQKNEETDTKNSIIDFMDVSNTFIPDLETNKYRYENEYIENIKMSSLEATDYRQQFYKFLSDRNFDKKQYEQIYFIKLLLVGIQQTNDPRFYFLLNKLFNDDILGFYLEDYELYLYQLFLYKPNYFIKSSYQYKEFQIIDYINQFLPESLLTNKNYFEINLAEINLENNMLLIEDKTVHDFKYYTLEKEMVSECPHIEAIFSPSFETGWKNKTIIYYDIFNYLNDKITKDLTIDELDFYKQKYYPFFKAYIIKETR